MYIRNVAALAASVVLSMIIAGPASATLITGTFAGIIYDSYDETNLFGAGIGSGVVDGQTVTGTFSYVLEQVPSNQCSPGFGCYYDVNGPNWLNTSVTINGVTIVIPGVSPYFQGVYNYEFAAAGNDLFIVDDRDYLMTYDPIANDNNASLYSVNSSFYDYQFEFAAGYDVPTANFTWTDDDLDDFGDGQFFHDNENFDFDTLTFTSFNTSYANWSVTRVTLGITQIPEPASVALFVAGLLSLGWLNSRRKTR
jgi:hypothetical protein